MYFKRVPLRYEKKEKWSVENALIFFSKSFYFQTRRSLNNVHFYSIYIYITEVGRNPLPIDA